MNKEKVLYNLNALASGVNPKTGEIINEMVFNDPEIIRTLFHAIELIKNPTSTRTKSKYLPENAGKKWELEDDQKLTILFRDNQDINSLMSEMKRTRASILSRLAKLGLINKDEDPFGYKEINDPFEN